MFDIYYANKRKEKTTGQYNYNSNNQCYQTENINNYNYDTNINTNNINQINTVNNGYYNKEINHASSDNQSKRMNY